MHAAARCSPALRLGPKVWSACKVCLATGVQHASGSKGFKLRHLGREELLFLLDEVSSAGERQPHLWKVYSKRAKQEVPGCNTEDLCRMVRALCRVQYIKRPLLNAIKRRVRSPEVDVLSPRLFSQLLSDLRRLRFMDAPMLQDMLRHWRFHEKLQEVGAFDLSLLLIAFARSSMRDEDSVSAIGRALRQKSSELSASAAAGSLYALALLDVTDETGAFLVAKVLPRCLGQSSNQELVNIAFALVVLDLPGGELLSFALERLAPQAESLDAVGVHALRIVAHAVKYPEALRPRMRQSFEEDVEVKRRCVKGLQQVLLKTQHMAIQCPTMSSKLQKALERYFKELQVAHLPEQAVGPYVPDFVLPLKIAVEVDGYTHFYAFSQRLTAKSALKRRVLRALGWGVVSLPHFHWLELGHQEKLVFLIEQIEEVSQTSFSVVQRTPLEGFSPPLRRPFDRRPKGREGLYGHQR
eukprot:s599_g23.t1